jgi:hypothetical protein
MHYSLYVLQSGLASHFVLLATMQNWHGSAPGNRFLEDKHYLHYQTRLSNRPLLQTVQVRVSPSLPVKE